jgi:hypothetical protein
VWVLVRSETLGDHPFRLLDPNAASERVIELIVQDFGLG